MHKGKRQPAKGNAAGSFALGILDPLRTSPTFVVRASLAMTLLGCLSWLPALGLEDSGIKGPTQTSINGLTYWIELNRGGTTSKVTQKEKFLSGDKIRFHVQPSIDGFAYIVLKTGSRGERMVLFPMPGRNDDNHVTHGIDYAIPDDFLEFDAHPGQEQVSLLFSKTPVDADLLLTDSSQTVELKSQPGSKDLVPARIKVLYNQQGFGNVGGSPDPKAGDVTITQESAGSVLHIDVDLEHSGQ
jgi:hypothetical protein